MIKVILDSGLENQTHCARVNGLALLKRIVGRCDLMDLSHCCDVPVETIEELATAFARSETGAVIARTGAGMGVNGTINIWLAQIVNIISGRLDSVGGLYYMPGVLDVSGQCYEAISWSP